MMVELILLCADAHQLETECCCCALNRNLTMDSRLLSGINPNSASTSGIIMSVACIGATVCAGVYIIWGPEQFFRKRGRCSGLVNLGNTCFINTILQSLASLSGVKKWLEKVAALHDGPLGQALSNIVKALNEDNDGVYSPLEVLQALRRHCWTIDFQQQDAHELYHILLNTLAEEMIYSPSLSDIIELERVSNSKAWSRAGCIATPSKPLSSPLRGMLTSELHCVKCNHSLPLKYEFFDSISLTLPQYKCTLENCLLEFVKSEVVYDVECCCCSKRAGVQVKQAHLKKLQLGRAPPCLSIHFNRTEWVPGGFLSKNNCHMTFPVELDISKLMKYTGSARYLLCAVVEHRGGPSSGHYLTYRRCGKKGRTWVCASDNNVYTATIDEALKAQAYMLFYCQQNEVTLPPTRNQDK